MTLANGGSMPSGTPDVRDILKANGEDTPEWVIFLAKYIQEEMRVDAAVAAARARDLSRTPNLAEPLKRMLEGWIDLKEMDFGLLTTIQLSTVQRTMEGMQRDLCQKYETAARP